MAVKHWNTGASAERYRQENEPTKEKKMTSELKKVLRELLKIDSYYYDSIYEYLKDVHQSTKKMKCTSEQASKGGSVSIPVE